MNYITFLSILLMICLTGGVVLADSGIKARKVIISTDIGSDIDDAWALVFALKCPELDIDSVLISHGPTPLRAKVAAKLLSIAERDDVPVLVGKSKRLTMNGQREWAKDFTPKRPLVADGARAAVRRIMASKEKVTIIPIGPLTDVARMLEIEPKVKEHIDEIILMGGAAYHGYRSTEPPCAEYNILSDVKAAQAVFESGLPVVMVGLDVTRMMQPSPEDMNRIAGSNKPLAKAMQELFIAWGYPTPTLFDVVAVAVAFQRDLVKMEHACVKVSGDGLTQLIKDGEPNAHVCVEVYKTRLMKLFMDRVLDLGLKKGEPE